MSYDKVCFCCERLMREPYIRCAECTALVCPQCFAQGAERSPHCNWHSYSVASDEIPVLENGWSARDERFLLELIGTCGYGNWVDISRKLNRTQEECKEHYDKFHLTCLENRIIRAPLPPHLLKLTTDQPPRMIVQSTGTYNSLRSEIWPEYDTGLAELDLAECVSPSECADCCDPSMLEVCEALQEAMVQIYNERLRERKRRHQVIRNHGLIQRYYTLKRFSALSPFSSILTGYQMDFLLTGLARAEELRVRFSELCELRANGVQTKRGGVLMKKLAAARQEQAKALKAFAPIKQDPKCLLKREMRPLQVTGLPQSERLSAEERELCAQARLVPESFFQFKNILVGECTKQNGIKLAQARKAIKIDVNKTRKLFDFLMTTGAIYPPLED